MAQFPQQHCFAPDLPGYNGSSPAPKVDLPALAADLIFWLDSLDLREVTLLGWSLGGILAQYLAAHFPQRIKRLVLVASTPRFVRSAEWPHGLPASTIRALGRDYQQAPLLTLEKFTARHFPQGALLPATRQPTIAMATALGGLELLRSVDLRAELGLIPQPTLVLHGCQDEIIPVGAGEFLATRLPQGLFHAVAECGHAPFRSALPQVSALLRDFLS
jgi:pimeloyl-[acyl-carrier protein] methyl ester esterase